MKKSPATKFKEELTIIMTADLEDKMHLEAIRQAKIRAGFSGVTREVRDEIQQTLTEQICGY